jgi:hypothetical protein
MRHPGSVQPWATCHDGPGQAVEHVSQINPLRAYACTTSTCRLCPLLLLLLLLLPLLLLWRPHSCHAAQHALEGRGPAGAATWHKHRLRGAAADPLVAHTGQRFWHWHACRTAEVQ